MPSFRRPERSRADERGQILVIAAGGMIALLLIAGLVIDGGIAFINRRDAQNASDIAAMAGTRLVAQHYTEPTNPASDLSDDIYRAIGTSTDANDCGAATPIPCTWSAWYVGGGPTDLAPVTNTATTLPAGTIGVRVVITRQPGTFISGIAGIHTWDVTTEATAAAVSPTVAPPGQLLPIALKNDPDPTAFNPGQVYDLTDGKDAPGGFGYISWTGSNDPNSLATSLCTPNNPAFTFPTTFPGDPGKSNSSGVRACLDGWIASGQTVLIPIYSTVQGPGNNATYTIVGVAAFVLTSRSQPAVDNIQGYFVGIYPFPTVPGGVGSTPPQPGDISLFLGLIK